MQQSVRWRRELRRRLCLLSEADLVGVHKVRSVVLLLALAFLLLEFLLLQVTAPSRSVRICVLRFSMCCDAIAVHGVLRDRVSVRTVCAHLSLVYSVLRVMYVCVSRACMR